MDDDENSAESMATLLELSGNRVKWAGDGLAALETIEEFCPQIVFLDIDLPKMNGIKFVVPSKRVRSGYSASADQ